MMQRHRQLSLGSFSKQISEHFEFCLKKHSVTGAPPSPPALAFPFPRRKENVDSRNYYSVPLKNIQSMSKS